MKKILFLALLTAMLFSCSDSDNEPVGLKAIEVKAAVDEVNMWGNLVLDIPKDSLYKVGYDNGDIVTISGGSLTKPLDMAFTDKMMSVGTWGMCLTYFSDEATLTIGLANASFSDRVGGKEGDILTISLKEKGGFRDVNERMKLWKTDNRSDYDSDEMFANFYPVECHGMKSGVVYRSSDPLLESNNPVRYEYADRFARNAGINTIISIADTEEDWQSAVAAGSGFGEYCNERYSKGALLFHKFNVDIFVDEQAAKVGRMLRAMIENNPPYLICCSMGRDRTGLIAIILQVLAGTTYEEIESGYMRSYYNWHRLQPSSESYNDFLTRILHRTLYIMSREGDVDIAEMCSMTSFPIADIMERLPSAVESYLKNKAGLSIEEIEKLRGILSVGKDTPKESLPVVILDTDIASSADDLVTMSCLYHMADKGKVNFAAIMVNRNGDTNAKMADIMNTYYKHPEVKIGVTHTGPENPMVWIDYWKVCEPGTYADEPVFPRSLSDAEISSLPDAAKLYRKILGRSEDHSVVILSIGFANNLARLLESQADEYSPLDGVELVRRKVKGIYLQAGHYGVAMEPDFNFKSDPENAIKLMDKCPAPMYFSPQEAGDNFDYTPSVMLADLKAAGMADGPLYHCYKHHDCETGQRMWDMMPLLSWLHPEYFDTFGPYDITLEDDMILNLKLPEATSNHNRYVQFPNLIEQEAIMGLIRRYCSLYDK